MLRPRLLGVLAFLPLGLVLFASACDDHDGHHHGGGESAAVACEQLTSCGTCTPVSGCGWCETSNGQGLCASDPDECASAQAFSWTWDPTGCRVVADASAVIVSPTDAGPAPLDDAGGVLTDAQGATPVDASDGSINTPIDAGDASDGS